MTRQRDALVQQQVQKLQIQQTIQTLQQTQYLSNPAIFRDYSNLVDQMNVQIAQEAQKVKYSRSILVLTFQFSWKCIKHCLHSK